MASIKTNTTAGKRKGKQYIEATVGGRKVHRYALDGSQDVILRKAGDLAKVAERKALLAQGAKAMLSPPKTKPAMPAAKPGYLRNTVKGSANYGKQYREVVTNGMLEHVYANGKRVPMGPKKKAATAVFKGSR